MLVENNAKELLNQVKMINEDSKGWLAELGEYQIRMFTKPGRVLMSCSCENHSRYTLEQPLCKHKLACIYFRLTETTRSIKLSKESLKIINENIAKRESFYNALEKLQGASFSVLKSIEKIKIALPQTNVNQNILINFEAYVKTSMEITSGFEEFNRDIWESLDQMAKTGEVEL